MAQHDPRDQMPARGAFRHPMQARAEAGVLGEHRQQSITELAGGMKGQQRRQNRKVAVRQTKGRASLGQVLQDYIIPLFSILLGAVLLKEQLGKTQLTAIALAAVAVVTMTVAPGRLPLVALGLSLSWGHLRLLQEEPAAWPQSRLHAPGALPLCVGHPAMADADRAVAFGTGSSAGRVANVVEIAEQRAPGM
ncbi:hypothetical protein [Paracoccus yeei]|uniref:hypothetical protein n=1 Tax=Paracoccus yeei TaxID=147645 RepID=UPI003BF79377